MRNVITWRHVASLDIPWSIDVHTPAALELCALGERMLHFTGLPILVSYFRPMQILVTRLVGFLGRRATLLKNSLSLSHTHTKPNKAQRQDTNTRYSSYQTTRLPNTQHYASIQTYQHKDNNSPERSLRSCRTQSLRLALSRQTTQNFCSRTEKSLLPTHS